MDSSLKMLFLALFLSSASALEIALNMTGSGTAQSQLTSAAASAAPQTITEIVEPATPSTVTEQIETASPSITSSASVTSPAITDGPIYTTISCYGDGYGQNCLRSPEYPFWYSVVGTPGNFLGGFTPEGMENPWAFYTSFLDYNLTSGALESATSCAAVFYSNLDDWLATAPITTSGPVIAATSATETLTSFSSVETLETSVGIGNEENTYTETVSGALTTTTETATSATIYSTYVTTVVQQATTETIIYSAFTPYYYESLYTPTFASPCCSACTIYGGNIEVMYFPPATATGVSNKTATATSPSTVVNSAGFTFTSPSIYMAIQTLAASNLCGQLGSSITLATTLSFAQDALSTVPAYSSAGSLYTFSPFWQPSLFSPATFGTAPCTDVVTTTGVNQLVPVEVTYNPCYPYISIPPQVRSADPLWSTCVSQWSIVLYDPPYVISAAEGGLSAFSTASTTPAADSITSASPVTTTTDPASPGSTTIPIVAPTTTAILTPTIADPSPSSSPVVVDPSNPSPSTSPVVVDPSNPSPSSTLVAVDPGTSASSAGGEVVNPTTTPAAIATIGSSTITADSSSAFVIGTQTLTPGGQITVSGTPISLASNGATIVAGSSTQALAVPVATSPAPTFIIGSQTLSAGGAAITVSGTVFSLQSDGSSVVVGGSTQAIGALLSTPEYIIASGSQTLVAGGAEITVSGTVVSLQTEGSSVVIGGSTTEALSQFLGSTTTTGSLGGVIASVGGFASSTSESASSSTGISTYNGTVFTGGASKRGVRSVWMWGAVFMVGIAGVAWL